MKKWCYKSLIALLVLACGATQAPAQNKAGALTLSPMIGGYVFEGDQNLDHSLTVGLAAGYNLTENWAAELALNAIDAESDVGNVDVNGFLVRLDGLYHFMPENRLVPYLAAGLGQLTLDPSTGPADEEFNVNYGGGVKYFLSDDVALRGDVRHVIGFEDNYSNLIYTAGVLFQLGPKPKAMPARDSDGDGVADDKDACPNTPQGVKVNERGCPIDSDKDGVADYLDVCPDTPLGAPVDAKGCPKDSDGDGVFDYRDKCPDTAPGVMVDENGCVLTFTLQIEFDTDKADIRPQYHNKLGEAAAFIRKYPAPQILVAGHTDNVGDDDYNLQLSQRRAESVRQYLIDQFHIDANKLVAKGFGKTQPVADNATSEGRQKNRRVDITCCTVIPK